MSSDLSRRVDARESERRACGEPPRGLGTAGPWPRSEDHFGDNLYTSTARSRGDDRPGDLRADPERRLAQRGTVSRSHTEARRVAEGDGARLRWQRDAFRAKTEARQDVYEGRLSSGGHRPFDDQGNCSRRRDDEISSPRRERLPREVGDMLSHTMRVKERPGDRGRRRGVRPANDGVHVPCVHDALERTRSRPTKKNSRYKSPQVGSSIRCRATRSGKV